MEEIAVFGVPTVGGASSIPECILEVAPLATLFVLYDDSDLEVGSREVVVAEPRSSVWETMATQPMDISIPDCFKPPREYGLGQSSSVPTS